MHKTIRITGATDGIGLETARQLIAQGHRVLVHGRNSDKLQHVVQQLSALADSNQVQAYLADFSLLADVAAMAQQISEQHNHIDVLINNAGVFRTTRPITNAGLDVRFVVNTIAPYLLTQKLLPLMSSTGRVINLSSAAQSPVDPDALTGKETLTDEFDAYAQSKLAITAWSHSMAQQLTGTGPAIIAVNPGSMLGTKMVTEGFGVAGHDIGVGADILIRAALADEFANASGRYFDNDSGIFSAPHHDALDPQKTQIITAAIDAIIASHVD